MASRVGKYKISKKETAIYEHDVVTATFSSMTVSGATALDGGLTMDTNKFTVANTSGNTAIAGTLEVDGNATIGDAVGDSHTINGDVTIESNTPTAVGGGFNGAETATVKVAVVNGEIVTTILADITGLLSSGTVKDVIGEDDTAAAYLTRITSAVNGVIYRASIACTETPAGSNAEADLDLVTSSDSLAEDAEYDSGTTEVALIPATADWTLGLYRESAAGLDCGAITANSHYVYLADGSGAASGGTYTAGKFIIKLYGATVGS